jgi:hypothetical protein
MRFEVFQAIRDSRLHEHQKMFLFITESRGADGMFCVWQRNAADMGMSKDIYYRTRKAVIEADLVRVVRRMDGTTIYHVNTDALTEHVRSHGANADSHSEKDRSHSANDPSRMQETKKNTKNNVKKNLEEEPTVHGTYLPEDDSGLTGNDTTGLLNSNFPGLLLNPGSLELTAGGPGESADPTEEERARRALALCEGPGTPNQLNEEERRRAVELMLDRAWQRHLKTRWDRAIEARNEVVHSRELTW